MMDVTCTWNVFDNATKKPNQIDWTATGTN